MATKDQKISCPNCSKGEIHFEINKLLSGTQFSCPVCSASIGLATESRGLVKETMDKLESLKNSTPKNTDKNL